MATSSAVISWELLSKNNVKSDEKISANKSKTSHEFGNNRAGIIISRKLSIALIKPTFTAAAYDIHFTDSFHCCLVQRLERISTHLNILSSKVANQLTPSLSAFSMSFLPSPHHLKMLLPKFSVNVLIFIFIFPRHYS
jgi:hypothetical protein